MRRGDFVQQGLRVDLLTGGPSDLQTGEEFGIVHGSCTHTVRAERCRSPYHERPELYGSACGLAERLRMVPVVLLSPRNLYRPTMKGRSFAPAFSVSADFGGIRVRPRRERKPILSQGASRLEGRRALGRASIQLLLDPLFFQPSAPVGKEGNDDRIPLFGQFFVIKVDRVR